MKEPNGRKTALIDGIEVLTTSEICRLVGLTLSVKQIIDYSNLRPMAQINAATYWRVEDLPVIVCCVASVLVGFAANFQLVLNAEKMTCKK